jgi:hypothetical protein
VQHKQNTESRNPLYGHTAVPKYLKSHSSFLHIYDIPVIHKPRDVRLKKMDNKAAILTSDTNIGKEVFDELPQKYNLPF